MKRLLEALSVLVIGSSSVSTLVACTNTNAKEQTINNSSNIKNPSEVSPSNQIKASDVLPNSNKVIDNLIISNYDMTSVRPIDPQPGIDYTKPSYKAWFDDGFNWEQFLGQAKMGDTLINKILDSNNKVANLGFITAFDPNDKTSKAPVVANFIKWLKKSGFDNDVMPMIGGIIPLWMANWTDQYGSILPGKPGGQLYQFLNEIRKAGKDFTFSFGGWNHDSLAMAAYLKGYSPLQLADLYGSIIHQMNLKSVDFDIEGTEDGRTDDFGNTHPLKQGEAARTLRLQAIEILKASPEFKNVFMSFTYPSYIDGIEPFNFNQVVTALKQDLITEVNIMPFDTVFLQGYGKRISLPGELAVYEMSAVNAFANDLQAQGITNPYSKIGLISMEGVNDTKDEVFTLTDEALVVNFAVTKHLAGYGFWSSLYDSEQQIYNANGGALRPGHNFGDLWKFEDMLNGTRAKDAYSGGLKTADRSFSNIARNMGTGQLYDFNGKTAISPILWQAIKDKGVAQVGDVSNITQQDITNLFSTTFSFKDNAGFGAALATAAQSKAALQAELNFSAWSTNYLDKNLQ